MKLKDIKTNKGQQELFKALVRWSVEQNKFTSLTELLNSSETVEFIKDYIEDVKDVVYKETLALKLQYFFITKADSLLLQDNFKLAVHEKATDPEAFSRSLPELNTTDKNQPDSINKLMSAQFSSEIKPTDVFFFPCAGRGSDALYICNTYNVPKDSCFFVEINYRLCLRLISLGFKNVICGDILSDITWNKLYIMLKEHNMKINKVLMNPPYDGSLHLKVLENVLTNILSLNSVAEVVSVQPVRWLEDPLAEYKQGSDYKKYKITVANKISNLQIIKAADATRLFKIDTGSDLAIYTFIDQPANKLQINTVDVRTIINKVITKTKVSLADLIEEGAVNGWRCEIKEMLPEGGSHSAGDSQYPKTCGVKVVLGPYNNGLDSNGVLFSEARSKNGCKKDYFRYSIAFDNEITAQNFASSHTSTFYKNLIQIMKYDQHAPLRFLPYMEDYSKVWTDEDYCKFFDLTEEESEFMCRKVDDYRVKDFINYINLDEE